MRWNHISTSLLIFLISFNSYAYKEKTHEELSENAVIISNISIDPSLLTNLGLQPYNSDQEFINPSDPAGVKISLRSLFRNGASYEDKFPRSLNHFYNPISDSGLPIVGPLPAGNTSPDWALEDTGEATHVLAGDQEFSYKEAMGYFYLALTSSTKEERDLNWGKTFQTLGQVIHHVQDMAQPDHARNDAHLDVVDPSWYEEFTDNEKGKGYFSSLMTGNTYPIPVFGTAREFWTTRDNDSDVTLRRGLADFTNRNFVTKETMFKYNGGVVQAEPDFPYPQPGTLKLTDASTLEFSKGLNADTLCNTIKSQASITFPAGTCNMEFLETTVYGAIAGENVINSRAATLSIFNKKLNDHNLIAELQDEDGSISYIDRSFTLNEFNFKARYDYLIPRAVAYSAGLINHFFRGKIDMIPNTNGEGWIIQNLSDEEMEGTFTLYCDDTTGNRSEIVNGSIITSEPLVSSGEMEFSGFDISGCYSSVMLVFNGRMGQEGSQNTNSDVYVTVGKEILLSDKIIFIMSDIDIQTNVSGTETCEMNGPGDGTPHVASDREYSYNYTTWYARILNGKILKKWKREFSLSHMIRINGMPPSGGSSGSTFCNEYRAATKQYSNGWDSMAHQDPIMDLSANSYEYLLELPDISEYFIVDTTAYLDFYSGNSGLKDTQILSNRLINYINYEYNFYTNFSLGRGGQRDCGGSYSSFILRDEGVDYTNSDPLVFSNDLLWTGASQQTSFKMIELYDFDNFTPFLSDNASPCAVDTNSESFGIQNETYSRSMINIDIY